MWNCTLFMHSTDEHLRHADIFFSNYCNLQFVHFEWIYILRALSRARASIIFMMSMILHSTVQRFFSSHWRRVINPKRLCFLKTFDSLIFLYGVSPYQLLRSRFTVLHPVYTGSDKFCERTGPAEPCKFLSTAIYRVFSNDVTEAILVFKTMKWRPCWCPKPILWELNSFLMQTLSFVPINLHRCWPREWKHSITVFARFRVNELHRSKICPDPRDLSGLRIWSTNSL